MTQGPTTRQTRPRRLSSAVQLAQRPPVFRDVGIISIFVACLGLLGNGLCESGWIQEMRYEANSALQLQRGTAMRAHWMAEFERRTSGPIKTASIRPHLRAFAPEDVSRVLKYLNHEVAAGDGSPLTQAQIAALTKLLSTESQELIDPDLPFSCESPKVTQIVRAWVEHDRVLSIAVRYGSALDVKRLRLDAEGREVPIPTETPATQVAHTPGAGNLGWLQSELAQYHQEYESARDMAILDAIQLILALVLLVAGVFVLRWRPLGVTLHWWYVGMKVPLCIFSVALIVSLSMQDQLDAWLTFAGCLYPGSLLIFLGIRAFWAPAPSEPVPSEPASPPVFIPGDSHPWREHEPLAYMPRLDGPVPRLRLRVVGIASLCVSGMSIALCVGLLAFANPGAQTTIATILLLLALLLLGGGVLLIRSDRRGILIHKIYAALQIVASIGLAAVLMEEISSIAVGFQFFFGAMPGMVGCIYPLLLFVFLRRGAIDLKDRRYGSISLSQ